MKKLITFLFAVFCLIPAFGNSAWNTCGTQIARDGDFENLISKMVGNTKNKSTQEISDILMAEESQVAISAFLGDKMFNDSYGLCKKEIISIAKMEKVGLELEIDKVIYTIDIYVDTIFDYFDTQTTILVYNDKNKRRWSIIRNTDRKRSYWPPECSDHNIAFGLSNNAAINVAGKKLFTEYGGSKNEFFLDFPKKDRNQRAFPGMVLMDKTGSTKESLVVFTHLPTAIKKAKAFAANLQNSTCGNQNLAVYLVSIAGNPDEEDSEIYMDASNGTNNTTGGGGGKDTKAGIGIGIGTSMLAGMTSAAFGATLSGTIMSFGLAASSVPVAGWLVGGTSLIIGGTIALYPAKIAKIDKVWVLDGPHVIR